MANRYLDLEAAAVHMTTVEYEVRFDALENERRELGDEKLKLQVSNNYNQNNTHAY